MSYNPMQEFDYQNQDVYQNLDVVEQQPLSNPTASAQSVLSTPVLIQSQTMLLGPESTCTTCVYCRVVVNTHVKLTNNALTHIAGALWCAKCCMCCCVPYSTDSAKNVDHYCPLCFRYLGTYRR